MFRQRWTASLLPALVGTMLPFWLRPPGFSFRWIGAVEFLCAAVLMHVGFSVMQEWFEQRSKGGQSGFRLMGYSLGCIIAACILGLFINSGLNFRGHVNTHIFIVYGISVIIAGLLYVVPPFSFRRRTGGEMVLAVGLGMMPVLGAYLVQAADLTRTVYLASMPLVVATGLWMWIDELISHAENETEGRGTLVMEFGPRFSARFGVAALVLLLYATLFFAVLTASVHPLAITALLGGGVAWKIVAVSRNEFPRPERMTEVRRNAVVLHFITGVILAASPLLTLLLPGADS